MNQCMVVEEEKWEKTIKPRRRATQWDGSERSEPRYGMRTKPKVILKVEPLLIIMRTYNNKWQTSRALVQYGSMAAREKIINKITWRN